MVDSLVSQEERGPVILFPGTPATAPGQHGKQGIDVPEQRVTEIAPPHLQPLESAWVGRVYILQVKHSLQNFKTQWPGYPKPVI